MFPCARHIILYLVLVQPRKHPDLIENFLTGMGGSRGGGGGGQGFRTNPERSQSLLSNTGPDPLKNRKATWPEFNVRPSSERQLAAR